MKLKYYLVLICLILSNSVSFCQMPVAPPPTSIIPPSPTAASLGKYGDVPVSIYTGIPNISIPLYTINSGTLSLPVTLNYHAGGIKVEEEASWVGLGWSLSAGGVITRSVRGTDDLLSNGQVTGYPDVQFPTSIDPITNLYNYPGATGSSQTVADMTFFRDANNGVQDSEPDVFYFNFSGHSGKFYIEKRASQSAPYTFRLESKEKMAIQLQQIGGYPTGDLQYMFTITTADGTIYQFGTSERAFNGNVSSAFGPVNPSTLQGAWSWALRPVTTSWYLDQITTPHGEQITFKYTSPSYSVPISGGSIPVGSRSESRKYILNSTQLNFDCFASGNVNDAIHNYYTATTINYNVYLSEIDFQNGKIVFQTSGRADIQPQTTNILPQKLDHINIFRVNADGTASIRKGFDLNYSYFQKYYNSGAQPYEQYDRTYSSQRLKLLNVTEKGADGNTAPPYAFDYIQKSYDGLDEDMPDKYASGKDYWGYFNGKINTQITDNTAQGNWEETLIPAYTDPSTNKYYAGANREPDGNYVTTGLLDKITYPTGGTTEFTYESNDYLPSVPQYITTPAEVYINAAGPQVTEADKISSEFEDSSPSSDTITVSQPTTVTIYAQTGFGDSFTQNGCSITPYTYPFGSVVSVGSTPAFQQGLFATLSCMQYESMTTQVIYVSLQPGSYVINLLSASNIISQASINWLTTSPVQVYKKQGGGVRIAKTVDYDGIDHARDVTKSYQYTFMDNGAEKSSGVLMSQLRLQYPLEIISAFEAELTNAPAYCTTYYDTNYLVETSESNIPLGTSAQGNPVGYSKVSILEGDNGKTEYNYINNPSSLNRYVPNLPDLANLSNGLLSSEISYKKMADGSFQKTKEKDMTYIKENTDEPVITGFKCQGCEFLNMQLSANGGTAAQILPPVIQFYDNISEWWHPQSETVTNYDQNNITKFIQTITNYFYDNPAHMQLTSTNTTDSKGDLITTRFTYPLDYQNITGTDNISKGVSGLLSQNIATAQIEKSIYHSSQDGSNKRLIASTFTGYKPDSLLPDTIYTTEAINPLTGFAPAAVQGGALKMDTHYKPKFSFNKYGDFGDITEQQKINGVKETYLWGYWEQYPVAKIIGADYNTAIGLINQDILYTPSSDAALRTELNKLRTQLPNAEITTYTYDPLIGMTSMTDAKGQTTYYEYDGLQRLINIKDQYGNVLKHTDYHYQGQ
jgi:YD repeat-containing protein